MSLLVFLGPPGSGKGTQAAKVAADFPENYVHLSTGQLLRDMCNSGSEIACEIKATLGSGKLVSDSKMFLLLEEKLDTIGSEVNVILDGFPRTITQAVLLSSYEKSSGKKVQKVIYFDIADIKLIERLAGRFMCRSCGAVYHKVHQKPKQDQVCDLCGSSDLYVREDDKKEVVSVRLNEYHHDTKPLVAYYEAQETLFKLDADQSVESIKKNLLTILGL